MEYIDIEDMDIKGIDIENKVKCLVGPSPVEVCAAGPFKEFKVCPVKPYSDRVCAFLDELSGALRSDKEARGYADVMTFAFWCRKGNIQKLKADYEGSGADSCADRIGRGLLFHIAPSNVPINFAYSWAFGLLAGNANIVRVSTRDFPQVRAVCRIVNEVFKNLLYENIRKQNAIVMYNADRTVNNYFSGICDGRLIWGGDKTIEELRRSPIGSRCMEVNFADRVSFGIISPAAVEELTEEELKRLAEQFYNDTYLMDQNACSTPHLILWKGQSKGSLEQYGEAKERFWRAVYEKAAKDYDLEDIKVSGKYTMLCEKGAECGLIDGVRRFENVLYVARLSKLPDSLNGLRGKFGLFYEFDIADINEIVPIADSRVQTVVYFGIEREEIKECVFNNGLRGIDRIVPVGKALDMGVIWDGYDIIRTLSRVVG